MKQLIFGQGLFGPTVTGQKKITLRKYRAGAHDFKKSEVIQGVFQDGGDGVFRLLLQITADTQLSTFGEYSDDAAREDGFADAQDAFNGLKDYYPDLKPEDTAATIRYEVLHVEGVPVFEVVD